MGSTSFGPSYQSQSTFLEKSAILAHDKDVLVVSLTEDQRRPYFASQLFTFYERTKIMGRSMRFEGLETRQLMTADVGLAAPVADAGYAEVARIAEKDSGESEALTDRGDDVFDDAEQWHGFLTDVAIWR